MPPTTQRTVRTAPQDFGLLIRQAAAKYRIDPDLLTALVKVESGNNPNAVSQKGAKGLGQLTDTTAAQYGVTDPFDPVQNLSAAAQHLSMLLTKYGGNTMLALAAYNAGEGAVDRVKGVPNFPETKAYIQKVGAEMSAANDRKAASSTKPGVGTVGPQKLPGDYIEVDRGGAPPPGIPPTTTGVGNVYRDRPGRPLGWMGAGAPVPPEGPTAFMGAGAPPPPQGQIPITSAVGSPGVSGIGQMSSRQMQDLMDELAAQQTGDAGTPADARTKDDLYAPPTMGYRSAGAGVPGVPDYGDTSSTQPSIAPFYSGGTFSPENQPSGLGWLSKLFQPVSPGGKWFTDQTQSER